jgi:hypothetical protein
VLVLLGRMIRLLNTGRTVPLSQESASIPKMKRHWVLRTVVVMRGALSGAGRRSGTIDNSDSGRCNRVTLSVQDAGLEIRDASFDNSSVMGILGGVDGDAAAGPGVAFGEVLGLEGAHPVEPFPAGGYDAILRLGGSPVRKIRLDLRCNALRGGHALAESRNLGVRVRVGVVGGRQAGDEARDDGLDKHLRESFVTSAGFEEVVIGSLACSALVQEAEELSGKLASEYKNA